MTHCVRESIGDSPLMVESTKNVFRDSCFRNLYGIFQSSIFVELINKGCCERVIHTSVLHKLFDLKIAKNCRKAESIEELH